jgi:4-oxalocrotonate tautomerase
MPLITLRVNSDVREVATRVSQGLSDLTVRILRKDPAKIVVHLIVDGPHNHWYVSGARVGQEQSIVDLSILVTKGSNSEREKSEWIAETWQLLSQQLSPLGGPSYITVLDIEANSWGYNGMTQQQRSMTAIQTKELT